jgi:hypothetical protein
MGQLEAALQELTPHGLGALIGKNRDLVMDEISHQICLIQRVDSVKASDKVQISPIMDVVGSQLAIDFRNLQRRELIQL